MTIDRIAYLLDQVVESMVEIRQLLDGGSTDGYIVSRQLSPAFQRLNLAIDRLKENYVPRFVVKEVWTTQDGSWDVSEKPYSVTQWARDRYLHAPDHPAYIENGGAATHILAAALDLNGRLIQGQEFCVSWPGSDVTIAAKSGGFADFKMGASYSPEDEQAGAYEVEVKGVLSERLCGLALPDNHHISVFVVFQEHDQ